MNALCDIAAVVVLYNPDSRALDNIQSYLEQVSRLLVVDNSEVTNESLIAELQNMENVVYIPNQGNMGIAKALNQAAEQSSLEGFDYLLTMDQDSFAPPGMVSALMKYYGHTQGEPIGVVAPVLLTKPGNSSVGMKGADECETVMTSGSLLNLGAYEKVGPFLESLFIDFVDIEYCLRLRRNGYKVLRANDACLKHHVGSLVDLSLGGKKVSVTTHFPLRKYYKTRNRFWVWKNYHKDFPGYVLRDRLRFGLELLRLVLFEPERKQKLRMVWQGLCDYRRGRLGKFQGECP